MIRVRQLTLPALVAVLALVLGACGGSGSGSVGRAAGGAGNVAILITDDPTIAYGEIHVTITEISLIPRDDAADPEPVVLFVGEETLDLLQLRDYSELFTIAEDVPVADYEKVRLSISLVVLVDTRTDPHTTVEARLPSGKIDLVPDGPLHVTEDDTLYLEIDIDAQSSVLIVEAGTGELIFRPVAFVRTYEEGESDLDNGVPATDETENDVAERAPLLSVSGGLRMDQSERLLVCPSPQAALAACARLRLDDDSAVFDSTGVAVGVEALTKGAQLVAMGLLRRDPDDGRRVLDVLSAVLGTRPTIGTRGGVAGSGVDGEDGMFVLRDGLSVALAAKTPVVDSAGTRLGREAIVTGQGMTIMGIMRTEPLPATLVVLRGEPELAQDNGADEGLNGEVGASVAVLRGELISVQGADTLQVKVGGAAREVRLAAGGMLVISGQGSVGPGALVGLADYTRVSIMARGTEGESYFEAEQIVAVILDRDDQVLGGGPPPGAGPPEEAGPPAHAGPPPGAGPPR
jgi:hypothetical protein